MADLIERQALIEWLKKVGRFMKCCENTKRMRETIGGIISHIEKLPTVDAEPVNPWVNVAHEKPPCRGHYFIAYKFQGSDMRFFGEAFWHDDIPTNGHVNGDHFSNEGVDGMYVTHWMEIPKLPNYGAKMDLVG